MEGLKVRIGIIRVFIFAFLMIGMITFSACKDKNQTAENQETQIEEINNQEESSIDSDIEDDYSIEPIDAEAYLSEIGEIQEQYDAASSEKNMAEKEVLDMLSERGFGNYPVQTNYFLDGEYHDAEEISQESSEKHPIYETYFVSADESVWSISVINGVVYANPIMYNFQEDLKVPVVISETAYMTSYDNVTNQFFEVILDDSEILLKVIPRIDAESLEKLTIEEIDKL